jgi:hypothetical protein
MAYQLNYQALSALSTVDFASNCGIFVALDSTGRVINVPDATTHAIGILENEPGVNMPAAISYAGVTKVRVDTTAYPVGTYFMPIPLTGIARQADSTVAGFARCVSLEASDASGSYVAVRFL